MKTKPPLLYREIAQHLGISRMRVYQLEKSAIQKLRKGLEKDPYVRERLKGVTP